MKKGQTKSEISKVAGVFKAIGEPNRLHILSLLSRKELCVCELTSILKATQSSVSQHLARLRSVDLVRERRSAQWIYYSLNPDTFPLIKEILGSLQEDSDDLNEIKDLENHSKCKI